MKILAKNSEAERAICWVALAADPKDDFHVFKSTVYFAQSSAPGEVQVVATDGRRLHSAVVSTSFVERNGLEIGKAYAVTKRTKTILELSATPANAPWPNYDRIIPDIADGHMFQLKGDKFFYGRLLVAIQDSGLLIPRFDLGFIEDVMSARVDEAWYFDHSKAMVFACANDPFEKFAVVMPMAREK